MAFQLFLKCHSGLKTIEVDENISVNEFYEDIKNIDSLSSQQFYLIGNCKNLSKIKGPLFNYVSPSSTIEVIYKIMGGIDFQHREGSKIGSGGMLSESQAALERKERLRKLALETIDISKDPYFMRNHLGTFECKLCLTLHKNEGNYLAHTQGKRHQVH